MGRTKQALPFSDDSERHEGESLLRHAARVAVESAARPVVVVLGAEAEVLATELTHLPVHVIGHSEWTRGIGSSIKIGLECLIAITPAIDAVIISVCDQPHLSASMLNRLARAYRGSNALVVASTYAGVAGVPALFDHRLFSELQALNDGDGARILIAREPERVRTVPFPLGAIDLDTPESYAEWRRGAGPADDRED